MSASLGGSEHGATSVGGPDDGGRRKKPWWLWLLLAALAVVLLLLLTQCGGDDDTGPDAASPSAATTATTESPTSTTTESPTSTTTETSPDTATDGTSPSTPDTATPGSEPAPGASPSAPAAGGNLTADGVALLPLAAAAPAGDLSPFSGQAVQGRAVTVLTVPADEGFWVGSSKTDRIWVQLSGEGESSYQVSEGDSVDLDGVMVAHDAGFADQVGVTTEEGAEQLAAQAQHIEVETSALTRSP